VCTANICRSPVAERLAVARSRIPSEFLGFSSAGTHAREGAGIDPPSARALVQLGVNPDGHQSRVLSGDLLEQATLILTATIEHRDYALRRRPSAMRKTFTLKEFARLTHDIAPAAGPDDVTRVIVEAAGQRGLVHPGGPKRDDIDDPFRANESETLRAAVEISVAVDAVLAALGVLDRHT